MGQEPSIEARRAPVQERGAKRVDAILAAAEALLVEVGFDALTLTAVAERSGSSIGSLYRFFSSKEQLLLALAHRLAHAVAAHPTAVPPQPLAELSPAAFAGWYISWLGGSTAEHPALLVLLHHIGPHCEPLEAQAMAPIDAFLRARAPALGAHQRTLATRMALTLVGEGMKLPEHIPGATVQESVGEVGSALEAYLAAKTSG